jgi:hypothetical protein
MQPGQAARCTPQGNCLCCGRQIIGPNAEPERIQDIDALETKFEEFLDDLNVSPNVKAIITVKLREASRWILVNCERNGFIG